MTQPQLWSSLRDGEEGCGDSVLIRPLGSHPPSRGALSHHSHPTPKGCLCPICVCPQVGGGQARSLEAWALLRPAPPPHTFDWEAIGCTCAEFRPSAEGEICRGGTFLCDLFRKSPLCSAFGGGGSMAVGKAGARAFPSS